VCLPLRHEWRASAGALVDRGLSGSAFPSSCRLASRRVASM